MSVRIDCLAGLLWICCAAVWLLLCFGFVGLLFVISVMMVNLLGGLTCFEFCLGWLWYLFVLFAVKRCCGLAWWICFRVLLIWFKVGFVLLASAAVLGWW